MGIRQGIRLTAIVLLLSLTFCSVLGGCLYLSFHREMEPLLQWEQQGQELLLTAAGEEWNLSLMELNQTAGFLQRYWIFLPRNFRLCLQLLTGIGLNLFRI